MTPLWIGPICVWLTIAVALYAGLWFKFVRRLPTYGVLLANLGLAGILSPGLVTAGHGPFLYPGAAFFVLGIASEGPEGFPLFSLGMCLLTWLIFTAFDVYLRKSDTAD